MKWCHISMSSFAKFRPSFWKSQIAATLTTQAYTNVTYTVNFTINNVAYTNALHQFSVSHKPSRGHHKAIMWQV